MKQVVRALFVGSLIFMLPVLASAAENLSYQVGADIQWRFMPFQKISGGNIAPANYPQGDVYAGFRLNEMVGLEFGYQNTLSMARDKKRLVDGDYYFSELIQGTVPLYFSSRTKAHMRGFYGSLVGVVPLSEEYRLKLIGTVGLAFLKLKMTSSFNTHAPDGGLRDTNNLLYSKKRWVPKLNVGIEHMLDDHLGLRALLGWEKTSKFQNIHPFIDGSSQESTLFAASLKNSTNLGLGLFYNF